MLLQHPVIIEVHDAAIKTNLDRGALLAGIDRALTAGAAAGDNAGSQLMKDLNHLNGIDAADGEDPPLATWLRNAIAMAGPRRERTVFEKALRLLSAPPVSTPDLDQATQRGQPRAADRRPPPAPAPTHFLDDVPLKFGRPETRALMTMLFENIWDAREVRDILKAAEVRIDNINLNQGPKPLWIDILERSRGQNKLRKLLETIAEDPSYESLSDQLRLFLSDSPPRPAAPEKTSRLGALAWQGGHERKTAHEETLFEIAWLEQGLECARSVVRLLVYHGGSVSYATGFFIAEDLILTNYHVFYVNGYCADEVKAYIGYEMDRNRTHRQHVEVAGRCDTIDGDEDSDWAVIRLDKPMDVPCLPLSNGKKVRAGDRVCIIQHPNGLPKKIGLVHNEVRYADTDVVQYMTDTEEGSSGSPVFNEQWDVVAIHHKWIPDTSNKSAGVRNQGISITRVVEGLQKHGLLPKTNAKA